MYTANSVSLDFGNSDWTSLVLENLTVVEFWFNLEAGLRSRFEFPKLDSH